jgi:site-specific recombinase XerD
MTLEQLFEEFLKEKWHSHLETTRIYVEVDSEDLRDVHSKTSVFNRRR